MEFAHRSDIESFDFTKRDTITIVAPQLRNKRPIKHSLQADIAENGLILYKTNNFLKNIWDFPLAPGFFVVYNGKTFVCTRVRELMGKHYILCDISPTTAELPPLSHQYLTEAEFSSYHFGPLEPVTITTTESKTPNTASRDIMASRSDSGNVFLLGKTNKDLRRLYFPQKPGFTISHRTGIFVTTRIRYAPRINYLVCDVTPA